MKYLSCFIWTLLLSGLCLAQPQSTSYFHVNNFQMTSPGAMRYGLYGYDNPAVLTYVDNFNLEFMWTTQDRSSSGLKNWGLFTAAKNIGFSAVHSSRGSFSVTDYKFSMAGGTRVFSTGFSYGWSGGDAGVLNRQKYFSAGLLIRPLQYLSVGLTGSKAIEVNYSEAYADIAIRPFGNEKVSLFADYLINNNKMPRVKKELWSAGAAFELIDGLRLTGRYFDPGQFNVGLQLSLGHAGFSAQSHYEKNETHAYNSYGIRLGGYDRNLLAKLFPRKDYAKFDLNGGIKYQRFIFFDNSNTLASIVREIDAAKKDANIKGIAINTSGMNAPREMLWEIRQKLQEFKSTGKKVVVFIDNPDIDTYHFASVADKVVMDPLGTMTLMGYVMGRTYYKGTLEKLGIGFDEWRFFKYKSAAENLSREHMSEGDRIQRQALVDGMYSTARTEIILSRGITGEEFDRIVNESGIIGSEEALARRLVDTLGRWPDAEKIIEKLDREKTQMVSSRNIGELRLPEDNYWGEPDRIAVIYALGACAMDEGINARRLVHIVESAGKSKSIKAIVLRVDSPGGDAMASDYVAEAVKEAAKKKPVIISQGTVAASGGYWLSMYGTQILAAPNTITGSIGVIGGWAYNKGAAQKLGFTTDFVKRGEHAELGFGASLPLIGISLPDRNLTDQEYSRMRQFILHHYDGFVSRVSQGRKLPTAFVDSVGQGRVWTGTDALSLKLIDAIGGLDDAIEMAKEKAGIKKGDKVRILEYPQAPMFNLSFLQPKLPGMLGVVAGSAGDNSAIEDLLFRIKHNGEPMPILPFEDRGLVK